MQLTTSSAKWQPFCLFINALSPDDMIQPQYNKSIYMCRADSRLAPCQWEASLQSNAVSYWLGTNLESALYMDILWVILYIKPTPSHPAHGPMRANERWCYITTLPPIGWAHTQQLFLLTSFPTEAIYGLLWRKKVSLVSGMAAYTVVYCRHQTTLGGLMVHSHDVTRITRSQSLGMLHLRQLLSS